MLLSTSLHYKLKEEEVVAEVVQNEVFKKTKVKWSFNDESSENHIKITLDYSIDHNEKYFIEKPSQSLVVIKGKSTRSLIYGAGRFLRSLVLTYEQDYDKPYKPQIHLKKDVVFPITSAPRYAWRGHQIAYRPKTHSYDALTSEQMKQEILDHVLFGANTIEMIPPKLDDCHDSPHFSDAWVDRLSEMSQWCNRLGVRVSLWYPAFPGADWKETFSCLKRLDCLFVPGGDPGGRPAQELFNIIRQQAEEAKKIFPNVEIWVSSQYGLSVSSDLNLKPWIPKDRLEEFYKEVRKNKDLLTGVVYGPWTADTTTDFRRNIPADLPIRFYPDLCHNLKAQYPVGPLWDWPFALAYNRESINPRPRFFTNVFDIEMPWCQYGAGCYSEGCGDDVNKHVWSCLLWEQKDVDKILNEYCEWYFGNLQISGVISSLEKNWLLPLKSGMAMKTLKKLVLFQNGLCKRLEKNWRWQMICFRVYCDAFIHQIVLGKGNASLAWPSKQVSSVPWRSEIAQSSQKEYFQPSAMALYGRLEASAGILYALTGMQLDVDRYGSMHEERGGHLELLKYVPKDDGVAKNNFKVKRLHHLPTTGQDGPIVEFADTTHPSIASLVGSLPSRWLSFYVCIWPSALPLEIEIDIPSNGKSIEIVYIGRDLLLEGGDYEELAREALPVRCYCNGTLLHDFKPVDDRTQGSLFPLPKSATGIVTLSWDVENRNQVTVRQVPVPVADITLKMAE